MKTLISIVTLAGMAAVIGAIVVGVESFDGTVTANPYEEGLAWDEVQHQKAALGWRIKLNTSVFIVGENDLQFTFVDKKGVPLDLPAAVSLSISRPSTDAYDKAFDTEKIEGGLYRAPVNFPLYGLWDIKVDLIWNEKRMIFEKRVFVDKG